MSATGVTVIGGGLAGCEAAFRLAGRGIRVFLYEMRPGRSTPAHSTGDLGELVCSNSLGADLPPAPAGILKQELRMLQSLVMKCADRAKVPAGKALAVDRSMFSRLMTESLESHGNVTIIREEVRHVPDGAVIVAAGPLMAGDIARELGEIVGGYLSFFDAAAPIVTYESIDMTRAYR
ncbi:MAG: FAD-dependent oxidoreductase, partial [Synergistaceae bacterium]|nr:FAD-dependent oxidoreductase [Synergistaceae bacterium]